MVRLAVRRTSSRGDRYAVRRAGTTSVRSLSKRTATKKQAVTMSSTNQADAAKIKAFLSPLNDFIKMRKKNYGANDVIATRLQKISTALNGELRKKIMFNANFAKHLNQINPALRGVTNVPQSLRNNIQNIKKYIKTHSNTQVMQFNNQMRKMLLSGVVELRKLQLELAKEVAKARGSDALPHVNPMIKQRFATLLRQFMTFRTYWVKHLIKFRLYSTKTLQASINQIKNLLDEKQKEFNRNLIILNRYAKTSRNTSGKNFHPIFSPTTLRALEWKWNQMKAEADKYKPHVPRYFEELKTAKHY